MQNTLPISGKNCQNVNYKDDFAMSWEYSRTKAANPFAEMQKTPTAKLRAQGPTICNR